jgi:hypothetical protein
MIADHGFEIFRARSSIASIHKLRAFLGDAALLKQSEFEGQTIVDASIVCAFVKPIEGKSISSATDNFAGILSLRSEFVFDKVSSNISALQGQNSGGVMRADEFPLSTGETMSLDAAFASADKTFPFYWR